MEYINQSTENISTQNNIITTIGKIVVPLALTASAIFLANETAVANQYEYGNQCKRNTRNLIIKYGNDKSREKLLNDIRGQLGNNYSFGEHTNCQSMFLQEEVSGKKFCTVIGLGNLKVNDAYRIKKDNKCDIFFTYHKHDDGTATTNLIYSLDVIQNGKGFEVIDIDANADYITTRNTGVNKIIELGGLTKINISEKKCTVNSTDKTININRDPNAEKSIGVFRKKILQELANITSQINSENSIYPPDCRNKELKHPQAKTIPQGYELNLQSLQDLQNR